MLLDGLLDLAQPGDDESQQHRGERAVPHDEVYDGMQRLQLDQHLPV